MSTQNTDSIFIRATKYIYEHGIEFSNTITNGFVYALVGIFFGINKKFLNDKIESKCIAIILLVLGFFINIIFYFKQSKKTNSLSDLNLVNQTQAETIQKLENQIQRIHKNYSEVFNEHLAYLFFKLELTDSDRISMYKYKDGKFFIIGRYSTNPKLKQIHRKFYNSNEGLISKAWSLGEYFINTGVPDYGKKTRSQQQVYSFFNNIAPISKETFDKITMKSKSLFLKSFMNTKGIDRASIIVIESEKSKAFEQLDIDKVLFEEEQKLISFVDKINWNLPDIINAENTGF
jgi:hypothetical protein